MAQNTDPAAFETISNLVAADAPIQASPFSKLYFVKWRGEVHPEVLVAEEGDGYSKATGPYVTQIGPDEGAQGVFVVDDADLFQISLTASDSGPDYSKLIWIYRMAASTGYKVSIKVSPTAFDLTDGDKGTWIVDAWDLYLVQTKDTGSGKIEIHRAGHIDYRGYNFHQATSLPQSEGSNGTWDIFGGSLYFIKYRNTRDAHLEVHRLDASSNYQDDTVYQSIFDVADGDNGIWAIGAKGDLYFVKTKNTGTGKVEVHIATAESGYTNVLHYASCFSEDDAAKGTWCVN